MRVPLGRLREARDATPPLRPRSLSLDRSTTGFPLSKQKIMDGDVS